MIFNISPDADESVKLLQEIVSKPAKNAARKIDKPLALYGAGKLGKMAIDLLERIGISPLMIIDANPDVSRSDPFWEHRKVLHPSQVAQDIRSSCLLAVTIATLPYEEMAATLGTQGWIDIVPFYDIAEAYTNIYPLSNGWVLNHFDDQDIAATSKVLNAWSDDISRAHHLQFIAWHRFREDWYFGDAPVNLTNRYFIPEIMAAICSTDSFMDVGAHHGEITQRFIHERRGQFENIWMIEPDPNNVFVINNWLNRAEPELLKRIDLLPCAVSKIAGSQRFFSKIGYACQLSSFGDTLINVKTIDQFKLSPSFIKLHLEGQELDALEGAAETINRCTPLIAATTYHSHLGVWRTPLWLMDHLQSSGLRYRFLFRNHSWCGTGSVIYCIPAKRAHNMEIN